MTKTLKTLSKIALVTFASAAVVACASKPKEEPVAPMPEPVPAPAPAPEAAPTPAPVAPVGVIPGSQQDFVVNVGDRVYFDLDQSSLRDDAKALLDAQAAWLVRYPAVKIRIEGNADERGTREYNFALGARRAESVSQYLTQRVWCRRAFRPFLTVRKTRSTPQRRKKAGPRTVTPRRP